MEADDIQQSIKSIREEVVEMTVDNFIPSESHEDNWDPEGLTNALEKDFLLPLKISQWVKQDSQLNSENIRDRCIEKVQLASEEKESIVGSDLMRMVEKEIMLKQLDIHWKEHLAAMDYLRQGIGLRGYAQKNPKQEYKQEAFLMFSEMLDQIKHDTISMLARIRIQNEQDIQRMEEQRRAEQSMDFNKSENNSLFKQSDNKKKNNSSPFIRSEKKVGRNDPCPCGSGKKYKHCCGKLT